MSTEDKKQDVHNTQIDINSTQNGSGLTESTEHPGLEYITPEAIQKNILGDSPIVTPNEKKTIRFLSHPIAWIINVVGVLRMERLNVLLLPLVIAAAIRPDIPFLCFFAIIPFSTIMTIGIDDLTARGEKKYRACASVLHAFSGNFVELVIETVALVDGKYNIVRSAILGAILCNITLVLGLAFLAGAWPAHRRNGTQRTETSIHLKDSQFKAKLFVNTSSSILALSVLALVIPAAFRIAAATQAASNPVNIDCNIQNISHATAIILMTIYIGSLVFQLKTHVNDTLNATEYECGEVLFAWYFDVFLIAGSILGVTYFAMRLVRGFEEFAEYHHIGSGFVGIVILPLCVVSNFIEHYQAIRDAYFDKVDTAVSLILNTSVQMALLVTPMLIIIGWIIGKPLTLDFNILEISVLACAVLIVNFLVADNMATWLEGFMLIVSYLLIAIAFFYFPEQHDGQPPQCNPFSRNLILNTTEH